MKILITGSNGLLGQKLVDLLRKQPDIEVIATARNANRLPALWDGYTFSKMDITISDQVNEVVQQHQPEVIINTAAMTQVDDCEVNKEECWKQNVTSVEYLIHAARDVNARLVHVSTDFIFDGSDGPLDESAIPNPVNYYGESKLAAEELVRQSELSWAIVRTVLVYGITSDMTRSNIVLWVKKSLEDGKLIRVVNDQWRTPTLAEDLAMGCYLVSKSKAEGIYHISGEGMLTPYDIAQATADVFGLDKTLIEETDASQFSQPAKRPPKTGFVIEKARKELGYTPHSFKGGLKILKDQMVE